MRCPEIHFWFTLRPQTPQRNRYLTADKRKNSPAEGEGG